MSIVSNGFRLETCQKTHSLIYKRKTDITSNKIEHDCWLVEAKSEAKVIPCLYSPDLSGCCGEEVVIMKVCIFLAVPSRIPKVRSAAAIPSLGRSCELKTFGLLPQVKARFVKKENEWSHDEKVSVLLCRGTIVKSDVSEQTPRSFILNGKIRRNNPRALDDWWCTYCA